MSRLGYLSFATSYTDRTFHSTLQFKSVRVGPGHGGIRHNQRRGISDHSNIEIGSASPCVSTKITRLVRVAFTNMYRISRFEKFVNMLVTDG